MKAREGNIEKKRKCVYVCVYIIYVLRKVRCYFHNKTLITEWNTTQKRTIENSTNSGNIQD